MGNPGHSSHLTDAKYGYDFVVATTQAAINSTMLAYLNGLSVSPTVAVYVANKEGKPVSTDYAALVKTAGCDPFKVDPTVQGFDVTTNKDVQALVKARFMFGFSLTPGIPPGYDPGVIPDVLTLGTDAKSVKYNMLCSEMIVVEYQSNSYAPPTFSVIYQPPGNAWIFQANVDLRMSKIEQGAFSNLSKEIRDKIKNLEDQAFSVQQLMFDFSQAGLMSVPKITGLAEGSDAKSILDKTLCDIYFNDMKTNGQPVLSLAVISHNPDPSAFRPTDLNMQVCPLLNPDGSAITSPSKDNEQLSTLNYLCASFGNALPRSVSFGWNWIEQAQGVQYDGVLAVNRNTFLKWLLNSAGLKDQAQRSCVKFDAKSKPSGPLNMNISYELNPTPGQSPTVTFDPPSDIFHLWNMNPTQLLISYSQNSDDTAGSNGITGEIHTQSSYSCSVSLSGNTVVIVQWLLVHLSVRHLRTTVDGNIINKRITDTYTLKVDGNGGMQAVLNSNTLDNKESISTNSFTNIFTDLGNIVGDLQRKADAVATSVKDFPLSALQGFIFPGGRTFAFSNFIFSDYGDLVASITYVDPTALPAMSASARAQKQAAVSALADQLRFQGLLHSPVEPQRAAINKLRRELLQQGVLSF